MAGLVGMFQNVPPVIKRRAGGLLGVVKAAVSRAEEGKRNAEKVGAVEGKSSNRQESGVISGAEQKDAERTEKTVDGTQSVMDRLWSNGLYFFSWLLIRPLFSMTESAHSLVRQKGVETITTSSLFGTSISTNNITSSAYSTSNSSLFGNGSSVRTFPSNLFKIG